MKNIVSHFGIYGLYGYKNVSIDLTDPTAIIVAENGMGKTTILSALKNVLTGNFIELQSISFHRIEISFHDGDSITILRSELIDNDSINLELHELSNYLKDSSNVFHIASQIVSLEMHEIRASNWYKDIYRNSPHSHEELTRIISGAKSNINNESKLIYQKIIAIREKLKGIEVLYLPTYRRVEKSNLRENYSPRNEDMLFQNRIAHPSSRVHENIKSDIAFGLADVETKLKSISEEIERRSNIDYRSLSATMLEDLMSGNTKPKSTHHLPEINDLSRFLGRVISRRQKEKTDEIVTRISNLYASNEIEKNAYLFYFLTRLNEVINSTKKQEAMVEKFVTVCNKYFKHSADTKNLTFDVENLQVIVKDEFTNSQIKLDDLSSGEKQIISFMSYLYLDNQPKLVLIDEPELSLSIEWQRLVIPDMIESKNVVQLLAITHSPFIFDNALNKKAKVLNIGRENSFDA